MRWALALGCVVSAAALVQAPPVAAAESGDGQTLFGFTVSASLQARVAPDYLGSKTYEVGPGGSLGFSKPGAQPIFGAPDDSPSLQLLGDRDLSAGLVARWRPGRDDHGALRGFDKIDWTVEPGAFVSWWPTTWLRLRGEARRGVRGDDGWTADIAADAVYEDPHWLVSVGPRLHLADKRFSRTYFGVTAAEAARSPFGIGAYAGDSAFTAVGALASAEYRVSRRWSLLGDVDYRRLGGAAKDSPIVARLGRRDQFGAALGFRYAFGQ